jgi:hypothetical protein
VRIEWSPAARASAWRYMEDQGGMRAVGAAVAVLALDPYPPEGFIGVSITVCAWAGSGSFMWSRKM